MSVQSIFRCVWHYQPPFSVPPDRPFGTQLQAIIGPQTGNVIAASGDPATIGSVLDSNGLTTPPGYTRVFELIAPAAVPQAYQ